MLFVVSDLLGKEEELIMTIITDQSEYFINVGDSVSNPKGSFFKTKDNIIKCGLFKGKEYLGISEFKVNNEIHWITISSSTPKKNKGRMPTTQKHDIRLRIKCSVTNNALASNIKQEAAGPGEVIIDKNYSVGKDNSLGQSKPYIKPKIGKLFHNRSCDNNISHMLNTEINSSRQSNRAIKEEEQVGGKYITQRGDKDKENLSLCLSSSRTKIDYQIRTAQKKVASIASIIPPQDNNDLEEQITDKAYENNIKNDEMISNNNHSNDSFDETLFKKLDDVELSIKAFTTKKDDFILLYDDNYLSEVDHETILLETELFIEKFSELQLKYHQAMNKIKDHITADKTFIKEMHISYSVLIKLKNKLDIDTLKNDYNEIYNDKTTTSYRGVRLYNDEMKLWSSIVIKCQTKKEKQQQKNLKQKLTKPLLNNVILLQFSKDKYREMVDKLNVYQKFFLEKILQKIANGSSMSNFQKRDYYTAIEKQKDSLSIGTRPNENQASFECFPTNLSTGNINIVIKNKENNRKNMKLTNYRSKSKYFGLPKYK